MANLKEMALELAVVNLVADLVAEHKDFLRQEMALLFHLQGSDSVKVQIENDKIGKTSLVEPKLKAYVADENAFFTWVAENHKDDIVAVVRESFKKYVLDNTEILDDGSAVLKTTGEIVDGIKGRMGTPYVSTRFDAEGKEKLRQALANGSVSYSLPNNHNQQITEA
jgi:hypothetical protein